LYSSPWRSINSVHKDSKGAKETDVLRRDEEVCNGKGIRGMDGGKSRLDKERDI
jgi:hypothetical protein